MGFSFVNLRFTAWVLFESSALFDTAGIPNTTNLKRSLSDLEPRIDIKIGEKVISDTVPELVGESAD